MQLKNSLKIITVSEGQIDVIKQKISEKSNQLNLKIVHKICER